MRNAFICVVVLVALISVGPGTTNADDGAWTKVYSRPAPQIYDIEMADDNVGLALTAAGILRTTDGGRTWTEPYPIAAFTYGDLAFATTTRAWAVAGSGVIRRTDDAGLTWQVQDSGSHAQLRRITVVGPQEGWVVGFGQGPDGDESFGIPPSVLLHTTDGGVTWRKEAIGGYGEFFDVAFAGRTGWLVASTCVAGQTFQACDLSHKTLLRTEDAGRTWQPLSETPGIVPERMQWLDTKRGFATSFILTEPESDSGILALYRTSDGGKDWTRIESTPAENTYEIHFQSERDGWISANFCPNAFECYPSTWHTTDGGGTWTSAPAPVGGGENFAVTRSAVLLGINPQDPPVSGIARLDLSVKQWSEAETPARQALRAIDFVDRSRGYALTNSRLLVTEDGGASWSLDDAPPFFDSIDAVSASIVWGTTICCSGDSAVSRSIDGAKTWQKLPVPFGKPLAIQAFDAERAIVSSSDDGLWRTDDAGASWRQIDPIAYGYGPLTFIDAQHGWTNACVIYICRDAFRVTGDGGQTWETRALPHDATLWSFVTPDRGWATLDACPTQGIECGSVIYSTEDGGRTWNAIGRGPAGLRDLTFVGESRGWATTISSAGEIGVFATTDGGRTWARETVADGMFPTGFAKTADRIGLVTAVGIQGGSDRSTIYRRDFAPELMPAARPIVRPPNTGSGPASSGRSSLWLMLLMAGVGCIGLVGGVAAARR